MTYTITQYSRQQAKKHGVSIQPSRIAHKKLDVFRHGELLASVGDDRYNDYPTWMAKKGKDYADERRRLYKIRHQSTRLHKGTPSWWADTLLW